MLPQERHRWSRNQVLCKGNLFQHHLHYNGRYCSFFNWPTSWHHTTRVWKSFAPWMLSPSIQRFSYVERPQHSVDNNLPLMVLLPEHMLLHFSVFLLLLLLYQLILLLPSSSRVRCLQTILAPQGVCSRPVQQGGQGGGGDWRRPGWLRRERGKQNYRSGGDWRLRREKGEQNNRSWGGGGRSLNKYFYIWRSWFFIYPVWIKLACFQIGISI